MREFDMQTLLPLLVSNTLTQSLCVAGVNQLMSVRILPAHLHCAHLIPVPLASFFGFDKHRSNDTQSAEPLHQRLVVRFWLERSARVRCRSGWMWDTGIHIRVPNSPKFQATEG